MGFLQEGMGGLLKENTKLNTEISALNEAYKELIKIIQGYAEKVSSLNERIKELEESEEDLKRQLEEKNRTIKELERVKGILMKFNKVLNNGVIQIEKIKNNLTLKVEELEKEVKRLEKEVEDLKQMAGDCKYFLELEEIQKIVYERVMNVYVNLYKKESKANRNKEFIILSKEISNIFLYAAFDLIRDSRNNI